MEGMHCCLKCSDIHEMTVDCWRYAIKWCMNMELFGTGHMRDRYQWEFEQRLLNKFMTTGEI